MNEFENAIFAIDSDNHYGVLKLRDFLNNKAMNDFFVANSFELLNKDLQEEVF